MTFEEMAKKRYSVRKFSSRPVEEEKLQKILDAVCAAPTAKDRQCVRVYVLRSKEALEKTEKLTPCVYGASTVLMFTYEESEAFQYPEQPELNSGAEDCSIAATHVMFEAMEQGLGTCWLNLFTPKKAGEAFAIPKSEHVVLLMDVGYIADDAKPGPLHDRRKAQEAIVHLV